MDVTGLVTGSIAILSVFVGLPAIVLSFIHKNGKNKREREIEALRYRKEILELEIERDTAQIKLLEAENKKLDRIIDES